MKRFALVVLSIAVVLVPATAQARQKVVHQSYDIAITHVDIVDIGPAGDSVGDLTVFTLEASRKGTKISTGHGYCVRTEVGRTALCHAISVDPAHGALLVEWADVDNVLTSELSVGGGTRSSRHVRGDGKIVQNSAGDLTHYRVTLNLVG